jgi:hypothetical protein
MLKYWVKKKRTTTKNLFSYYFVVVVVKVVRCRGMGESERSLPYRNLLPSNCGYCRLFQRDENVDFRYPPCNIPDRNVDFVC